MKTQTHTPGPWTINPEKQGGPWYRIEAGENGWVAQVPNPDDANAALIASAPELLMALRNLQKAVTNAPDIRVGEFSNLVEDAIAKAEGNDRACVLTGADGENPDDCTTHAHE